MSIYESRDSFAALAHVPLYQLDEAAKQRLGTENPTPLIEAVRLQDAPNVALLGAIAGINTVQALHARNSNPTRSMSAQYALDKERTITAALTEILGSETTIEEAEDVTQTPYHLLNATQKMQLVVTELWGYDRFEQMEAHGNVTLLGALAGVGFQLSRNNPSSIDIEVTQLSLDTIKRIQS